jgi:hypothetical protein
VHDQALSRFSLCQSLHVFWHANAHPGPLRLHGPGRARPSNLQVEKTAGTSNAPRQRQQLCSCPASPTLFVAIPSHPIFKVVVSCCSCLLVDIPFTSFFTSSSHAAQSLLLFLLFVTCVSQSSRLSRSFLPQLLSRSRKKCNYPSPASHYSAWSLLQHCYRSSLASLLHRRVLDRPRKSIQILFCCGSYLINTAFLVCAQHHAVWSPCFSSLPCKIFN